MDAQSIAQAEFLVVADLDAGDREALIRLAAPVTRAALQADFAALIEHRERFEWDAREQVVVAQDERWLGAIRLGERRLENPDSARVTSALLTGIRELGLAALPWTKEALALRQRLEFAREVDTRPQQPWPEVSDAALLATLDTWLAPWLTGMSRRDHLARLSMTEIIGALLDWNQRQRLADAPAGAERLANSDRLLGRTDDRSETAGSVRSRRHACRRRRPRAVDIAIAVARASTGTGDERSRELLGARLRGSEERAERPLSKALLAGRSDHGRGDCACPAAPQIVH